MLIFRTLRYLILKTLTLGKSRGFFAGASVLEMEDLQSSLTCRGLIVTALKDKGRCLYTTKDFSPGLFSLLHTPPPFSVKSISFFNSTYYSILVDSPRWVVGMFVDITFYIVCEWSRSASKPLFSFITETSWNENTLLTRQKNLVVQQNYHNCVRNSN